ncbi:MAG: hypothetical protein AABY22_05275, partial [Nanoarchaeota archaeon]
FYQSSMFGICCFFIKKLQPECNMMLDPVSVILNVTSLYFSASSGGIVTPYAICLEDLTRTLIP